MSSKVKVIKTVSGCTFEITPTKLVNVLERYGYGELRRSVTRKDVAKFFKKPVTGNYGDGHLPEIETTYDAAFSAYSGHDKYVVTFSIYTDIEKQFRIGCMEFGPKETAIIRRWATSYGATKVSSVKQSSKKVVAKKSSRKAA